MVEWFEFTLRAWDRRGGTLRPDEFFERLSIVPSDLVTTEDGPGSSRVRLLAVAMEDFAHVDTSTDAGAQTEAFATAVQEGLLRAAGWLSRQRAEVFEGLRTTGRGTDIFVGGWVTSDQFDLELPPEFLKACGVLGLSLSICTND